MSWKLELTFGDLLTIVTILLTLLVYWHARRTERRLQKAVFVRDYLAQFLEHPQLADTFFEIDYHKFEFKEKILGTNKELRISQLLDVLNSLGFSYTNGIIELDDIDETTLGYAIATVYKNDEIQKYLHHVDRHSVQNMGLNIIAFAHFRKLAQRLIEKSS